VEDYKLVIYFHAENHEDALAQARQALTAFDDGFRDAWLAAPKLGAVVQVGVDDQDDFNPDDAEDPNPSDFTPHRLVAQDASLSRWLRGFESRWGDIR
jgi:hypothetical protein